MAEHDPQAFTDLFESEPDSPSASDAATWLGVYSRLVELLERQLVETQRFSESVPAALQQYLSRENVKILAEELGIFRDRLTLWQGLASSPRSNGDGG